MGLLGWLIRHNIVLGLWLEDTQTRSPVHSRELTTGAKGPISSYMWLMPSTSDPKESNKKVVSHPSVITCWLCAKICHKRFHAAWLGCFLRSSSVTSQHPVSYSSSTQIYWKMPPENQTSSEELTSYKTTKVKTNNQIRLVQFISFLN